MERMDINTDIPTQIRNCKLCPLSASRSNAVPALPGKTYRDGGIALMLESPNFQDDRSGEPFTRGTSYRRTMGNTLDSVIDALAVQSQERGEDVLERDDLILMTSVRCKPEHRLEDHPEAIHACGSWTDIELEAYKPGIVVFLGNQHLAKRYLGSKVGPKDHHGAHRATEGRLWGLTYSLGSVFHNPELIDTIVDDLLVYKRVWKSLSMID